MSIWTTLKIKFELWWLDLKMRRRVRQGRERDRMVLFAGVAAAFSILFLASIVFGANDFTGHSGQTTQRATMW